jgi:signal transduction histidine kinase
VKEGQVDHESRYREVLAEYCRTHSEEALYEASLLSTTLIEQGLGPDEIVALHYGGMQSVAQDEALPHADRIRILNDAHQFLLEVMIAYGAHYKEFLDLRLAEAIRRAESAEHGQREKLEILAMIAHELGNPLTVALGNMQLAIRFLDAQDITNLRSLVDDSREALERLAALTGQLAAVSRGDDLTLEKEPVELKRVANRARALAQRAADSKEVTIQLEGPSEHVWVMGDEEALNSIASNLISNAVRYTPAFGTVTIQVANQENEAILRVTDTGIGMTEEAISRIFDKFFRAEEARKLEPKGLGMGLSIVDRLVRAHNGRVEVESKLGQGSIFSVILPASAEEASGA